MEWLEHRRGSSATSSRRARMPAGLRGRALRHRFEGHLAQVARSQGVAHFEARGDDFSLLRLVLRLELLLGDGLSLVVVGLVEVESLAIARVERRDRDVPVVRVARGVEEDL